MTALENHIHLDVYSSQVIFNNMYSVPTLLDPNGLATFCSHTSDMWEEQKKVETV